MLCVARRESLKRRHAGHHHQMVGTVWAPTPAPIYVHPSTPPLRPSAPPIACGSRVPHFWYPQVTVLQPRDSSASSPEREVAANQTIVSTAARSFVGAPATMLSIRADPPDQTLPKTLAIQCRTSAAVSNAHGRSVTIHGVVTQEVVSSTGKILIMAGSRVLGSGLLDPENGRFKSGTCCYCLVTI